MIWATRFLEEVSYAREGGGGKGLGGSSAPHTTTATYAYYANLAVGLCEGPIAFVRRIWADGREIDRTLYTIRVHAGTETQDPDPLIVAKEGADAAPAYRGLAYVVFERLPLANFGNRVPQLSFEVVRPVGALNARIRSIDVIPGAGAFAYAPTPAGRDRDVSGTLLQNRQQLTHATDWAASMDALQALCPNLDSVSLVVSWFGDDLRAGACTIAPRSELPDGEEGSPDVVVSGLPEAAMRRVSQSEGRPAYGGTPSDAFVIAAIRDLKARGLKVTLYPFVMMDVPAGNALPDPWTGAAGQPPYPWRGRITCAPAPGWPGTVDATAAAAAQVAALFGAAQPGHFTAVDDGVAYAGPDEWTLRRQILHYARLATVAGGVDAFVIGSEFVSLTRVRSAPGVYPAVGKLATLAADVRATLGPASAITYAADWTEYGSHVPAPGELRFPLDPLWASPAISHVGVDLWAPLGDWRDEPGHADEALGRNGADPAYLAANVAGGEGFDWFYADEAGRAAQTRLPIADGAYGKPWVYRPKDLAGWWSSAHVERVGGVELGAPTAWVPRSKPIRLMECGCPAVDKGANGPNAFPDPKSSAAQLPPFSRGFRNDLVQNRAIAALLDRFDPAGPQAATANPVSPLYGGRMVDPAAITLWCWDARPFPAFPSRNDVWADGSAWETGHWLTGRLEGMPLEDLLRALLRDWDLPPAAAVAVDGFLDGYVVDRPMSLRAAAEPLAAVFGFDAAASGGAVRFLDRSAVGAPITLDADNLVPDRDGALVRSTRVQEAELPREVALGFVDAEGEFPRASVLSRRLEGGSRRDVQVEAAIVLPRAEAGRLADRVLHDAWIGRETAQFSARPGLIALEVGDCVRLPRGPDSPPGGLYRITRIRDAEQRDVEARAVNPAVFAAPARPFGRRPATSRRAGGRPFATTLDLALPGSVDPVLQWLAVAADPWPGTLAVWRSVSGESFDLLAFVEAPSPIGRLAAPLAAGPPDRWDRAAALEVRWPTGAPPSALDATALSAATAVAVQGVGGAWEAIAFGRADLVGPSRWRLSRLLRGLGGSRVAGAPLGALVVALDGSLTRLAEGAGALGRAYQYRVGPAARGAGDAAALSFSAAVSGQALRPLAPVRPTARRTPAGVILRWLRQGRVDADAWEPVDIPLGEDREAYEVQILRDGMALRTLAATQESILYATADEAADFGAQQASLSVSIRQLSATVGAGAPLEATVQVK
ncbi:hypothetical protein GCM10007036_12910 [Alsobacter metallidurans]|uniref:Tail protein n=1 Tax=Alsobacter metallidurans TaxID=340221 RepID=A0A917I583_9HYPH|nr:glycoside hydrolase TIM-barrel-like domain-containing protein [Alsobacter metallidurans]GGH13955.1 hypothetical protein GCM10007036_12910 [Alsobacter metallidurans]